MLDSTNSNTFVKQRLHSLDFFRGLTMFLLIAEFTHLFSDLTAEEFYGTFVYHLGQQFHHHPWAGLRFWDLIQPFFMFIVGVALPFSVSNRRKKGQTSVQIRRHAWQRAFLLLLLGWGLYVVDAGQIVFRFQNVLAQLAVTYILAFLIMNRSITFQVLFSLSLILLTELIYRNFPLEGFNHPFVANKNFGTWLDMQYNGEDFRGSWVSFNAIPTAAHTIWGVLAGILLKSNKSPYEKIKLLGVAGLVGLIAGYGLSPFTPIIKRICTSSFVLVSGGWALLSLAFCYWIIDIKNWNRGVWIFTIVGLNPLFIYLFAHVGGTELINHIIHPFADFFFGWMTIPWGAMITHMVILFLLWYLCYFLYRKKVFIRI